MLDEVGAAIWCGRARTGSSAALGGANRTGGIAAVGDGGTHRLKLVAAGHSNAEVAAAVHVSLKTVEWNLSKIYRKLGVRSRTELAARFKSGEFPR